MLIMLIHFALLTVSLNYAADQHPFTVQSPIKSQPASEDSTEIYPQKPVTLMLILTREDVQCPLCRNTLSQLYDELSRYKSSLDIHCIVQIDLHDLPSSIETEEALLIMKNQFRGFFKRFDANYILYIDTASIIQLSEKRSPALMMLHRPFRIIKKWDMPLQGPDMDELSFFLQATGNRP